MDNGKVQEVLHKSCGELGLMVKKIDEIAVNTRFPKEKHVSIILTGRVSNTYHTW